MEALFYKTETLSIMLWDVEKENIELKRQITELKGELTFCDLELRETKLILERSEDVKNVENLKYTIKCLMELNKNLIDNLRKCLDYEIQM